MPWRRINVASMNHIYVYPVDSTANPDTAMRNYYPLAANAVRDAAYEDHLESADLRRVCTEFAFNPTIEKVNPVRMGSPWKVNEPGFMDVEWTFKAFVPESQSQLGDNLLDHVATGDTFLVAFEWGTPAAARGPDQFYVAGFGRIFGWPIEVAQEGGLLIEVMIAGDGSGLWRREDGRTV